MSNARPTSPKPPTFPAGSTVEFDYDGATITATFVERTSHQSRRGAEYVVNVQGRTELIYANGTTGRTMRLAS